ncbi:D-2-hydroxyacid dehydrogenase [Hymenobacter oligotrophus]|uniref:D-2-hydroxyacid dehydrogenase n=1 Tax=Hymenobacter oligotrophus TaxID=2319843 RepID=A0A3B7RD79_9BACT|nr:D-2-hydroxyacid dehydrogenase [Hymenobacter oligotrophus]AYA38871.1 D-2-hydroxyacid dehydrogenase [Hymenobacter oligotrophus]
MHLYVYTLLDDTLRSRLRAQLPADVQVFFRNELPDEQQLPSFQSANVILGNPPAAWFADAPPPALQFWQIDSSGFEQYTGLQLPVPVANMGDYFAWPCAESIVAGIMALYRNLPQLALLQAEKRWVGPPVRANMQLMRHKRVVVLGAGYIGLAVRQQLSGFGCHTQLLARTSPEAQLRSPKELKAVLPDIDLVINCLPGTAEGFYSAELIAAMQPGSVYASVGRGNTTDEPALIAALQTGHLGGAVLDVTAVEPLPVDNPLWSMPNVILTQHSAGGQPDEDGGKVDMILLNLGRFRNGEPLESLVDVARGY